MNFRDRTLGSCSAVRTAVGRSCAPTLRQDSLAYELFSLAYCTDGFQQLGSGIDLRYISVPAHVQGVLYHLQGIVLAEENNP